jgi:hypothetical protein
MYDVYVYYCLFNQAIIHTYDCTKVLYFAFELLLSSSSGGIESKMFAKFLAHILHLRN